jgi:hypothetical protein
VHKFDSCRGTSIRLAPVESRARGEGWGTRPTAGSFTLVPMSSQHTYLDTVLCAFPQNTELTPSNRFTVQKHFSYSSTTGAWHSFVTVPGSGKLNFNQKMVMSSGMVNPLVQSGKLSMSSAGKIKLTLKPTAAGNAALKNPARSSSTSRSSSRRRAGRRRTSFSL